jgi:16S rRNA (adenine1518-N6/adenine1519-N6)-dimethyltransferase
MQHVKAKKGLGQHFLRDKNIALKIVKSLVPGNYNTFIEVGPGTGALTQYLIPEVKTDFMAIELDRESYSYLLDHFPEHRKKFVNADFLNYSLDDLKTPIAVIGNFPYFISSQILFRILDNRHRIMQLVCMIQKEVAERLTASPGSKTYGILSVLLQAYYSIEYLFTVNEQCFSPPPQVKSAVIRLMRNQTRELNCDPHLFFRVVKTGFNQRRKVLRNSLQQFKLILPLKNQLLTKRPEQLSVDEFVKLTNLIGELNP